jgi:competence protein ComEC
MNKQWWQKLIVGTAAGGLLIAVGVWHYWPDNNLHLIACDVGQGDATLITYGFHQILIDAGPTEQGVLECLGSHLPLWDRVIEVVVMTHADADHIGGVAGVLSRYTAQTIVFNGDNKDTALFRETMEAVQRESRQGAAVKLPILGLQWRFNLEHNPFFKRQVRNPHLLQLKVLFPQVEISQHAVDNWLKTETLLWDQQHLYQVLGPETDNPNNRSIVLLLEFGKVSALLTGDLEEEGELSLLAMDVIHPVTILKAGHHGSKTSSIHSFVAAAKPETSLISVGANNHFGHPSPEVMDLLNHFDIEIWRTDHHGTIEVESDGQKYWVLTQK